ncbi:hypothetical protein WJX72_001014 [[Myrmecia] bisecta]|uniref:Uncharacterized protein n=1 Tax=[Myrmecia] bisecta TaxID=41462 RepID=A0AAW1QP09_9CHLO
MQLVWKAAEVSAKKVKEPESPEALLQDVLHAVWQGSEWVMESLLSKADAEARWPQREMHSLYGTHTRCQKHEISDKPLLAMAHFRAIRCTSPEDQMFLLRLGDFLELT